MAKYSTRKLLLFGRYSLALLLPKSWLSQLQIEAGDSVELEFDHQGRQIVVTFVGHGRLADKAAVAKTGSRLDNLIDNDWQPLTELSAPDDAARP
ncbi:MAG: AbrB/MazE/SpoVT family DNA-binding domain-containing protein [Patescibacteria group bacterium]